MKIPKGAKIRVAYVEDLTKNNVGTINVDSIETAKAMLKAHAMDNQYQSELHPIPGLKRYAAIEYLDRDGEWSFYIE